MGWDGMDGWIEFMTLMIISKSTRSLSITSTVVISGSIISKLITSITKYT